MQFAMLASSSSGNCAVVQSAGTSVLVDAGISLRRVVRGLKGLGLRERVDAILISHEHADHCRELATVARRFACPIYASEATLEALAPFLRGGERLIPLRPNRPLALGELQVTAFPLPHDAVDPCGFVLDDGRRRVGLATDLGSWTAEIQAQLGRCQAVALEANHDVELLENGRYPEHLKRRIRSPLGHLSNDEAGSALALLALAGDLRRAVLVHLSEHNNRPELALRTVSRHLEAYETSLEVFLAHKAAPSPLIAL